MHQATRFIHDNGELLRAEYRSSEELGRLSDRTVELLKESGGLRLLLAEDLGGFQAHPNDFFDWVMAVGSYHPSAGWVAGVCGVHPWEFSIVPPELAKEIFGSDPNTLTASPYAPFGRAEPVDGGYLLTGRWPYSTGTDHSDWVVLGGIVTKDGSDVDHHHVDGILHFVLPKGEDYEIVEGSWNVMGLSGTGSKDVQMKDTFVPFHRTIREEDVAENVYADRYRPGVPLYQMRFFTMFPAAIGAGTLGIAQGLLREIKEYLRTRRNARGVVANSDPYLLAELANAAADVDASVLHFTTNIATLYDLVESGGSISPDQRIEFRRNQVCATRRAVTAVNNLYQIIGSQSVQRRSLVEGFYRDLQVARSHMGNQLHPVLFGWGLNEYGHDIPEDVRY